MKKNNRKLIGKIYSKHINSADFDYDKYIKDIEKIGGKMIVFENETDLFKELALFLDSIGYEMQEDPVLSGTDTGSFIIIKKG